MKKLIIASALSAAFVSPAVFAQATGFTGFYGQVGLGMNSSGSNVNIASPAQPEGDEALFLSGKLGQQNVAGNVALGYNLGLSNGFNIGANVFYNIAGDAAGSLNVGDGVDGLTANNRLKNIWGISVEPGYSFSDSSLGFVKLGWAMADNSWRISGGDGGTETIGFGNSSGFLYGVGYKHLINKNVYVGVEVYQVAFSSKSKSFDGGNTTLSSKPTYTYGGIVLGARF